MPARPLSLILRAAVGTLIVAAVWTAVVLLSVRGDLQSARDALLQAREQAASTRGDGVADGGRSLARAEDELAGAARRLAQPGPVLVGGLPVLGRTVRGVSRTTTAALEVTRATRRVLALTTAGDPLLQDGRVDLQRVAGLADALEQAADRTQAPVARLDAQPLGLVPGVVAGPAREARDELVGVPATFRRAAAGLRALSSVLGADGPRRLLVLLENNAELRGTGGIVTVFAEAVARDGLLQVKAFRDVEDVADPVGTVRRVPAPADFTDLYGPFLADTTLWRNGNMAPDVPTSSAVLAGVAEASLGRRPDVVLWLDVPTIAAVLRATGPALLPDGSRLSAEDAVPRLLSTAYMRAPDTRAGQAQRRAELRGAADAVLSALLGSGAAAPPAAALGSELFEAAQGRHLALWAGDPRTQDDLAAAGLDGAVRGDGGDLSSFAVHNLGGGDADGNKLDFYARRQATVSVELGERDAVVEQQLSLRNTAPATGLPLYVAGRRTPGITNNLVSLALPARARSVEFERDGVPLEADVRRSGDHGLVRDTAALPPGAGTTWTLRYRLPLQDGRYRLRLVPQPLAVDAGLSVSVRGPQGARLAGGGLASGDDGALGLSGPFVRTTHVEVAVEADGVLRRTVDAVRRFWSEPVALP